MVLYSSIWGGVVGTWPGYGSGNQAVEAFHRPWQKSLEAHGASLPILDALLFMEQQYENWAQKFAWCSAVEAQAPENKYSTPPPDENPALIHGSRMPQMRRSTAHAYWTHRKFGNAYTHAMENSGTWVAVSANVTRRPGTKVPTPAKRRLSIRTAKQGIAILTATGFQATRSCMRDARILAERAGVDELDLDHWGRTFEQIAYVCIPPFPAEFVFGNRWATEICTCKEFGLHAMCEHIHCAQGLDVPGLKRRHNFQTTPTSRKRGRPRGKVIKSNNKR